MSRGRLPSLLAGVYLGLVILFLYLPILVMILLTVAVIDSMTSSLRHRLIGLEGRS